jgi:RimJ/RimL family protein N-acetyltransferase
MKYFFYCSEPSRRKNTNFALTGEYSSKLWRPTITAIVPTGIPYLPFALWWIMHHFRLFPNRDYSLFLIYSGHRLVHRSLVTPRYFRFPFMGKNDLQIGDTWTAPAHRGKGLATFAIQKLFGLHQKPGRKIWYVVDEENLPSIRAAEKAGFIKVGVGQRGKRFGMKLFGSYMISGSALGLVLQ